jgi:hypothetical protein
MKATESVPPQSTGHETAVSPASKSQVASPHTTDEVTTGQSLGQADDVSSTSHRPSPQTTVAMFEQSLGQEATVSPVPASHRPLPQVSTAVSGQSSGQFDHASPELA